MKAPAKRKPATPIAYRPTAVRRAALEAEAATRGVTVDRVLDWLVDALAAKRNARSMPKPRPPVFGHASPAARDVTPNFKKGRGDG